jgi:4-amino-4-deoxy-L-arabinose transferase-like glycosyltransferase
MVARVAVLATPAKVRNSTLAAARARIGDRPWPLVVFAATVVAAILRLPTLGRRSLWYDELISALIAKEPLEDILRARLHLGADPALVDRLYTNNPPLHLVLLHAMRWISTDDAALRLPFALAGIATVPVAYLVLKRLFDTTVAAAATVLLALSPIHIAYSQEARPTAFLTLFALGMLLFLLRAAESNRAREWVWMAVCGVLAVWTSYFALTLVLPALGLVCVLLLGRDLRGSPWRTWWRRLVPAVLAFGAVVISAAPLVPDLRYIARLNDVATPDRPNPLRYVAQFHVTHFQLVVPIPTTSYSPTSILTHALALAGLSQLVLRRRFGYRLALVWLLVPFVVLVTIKTSHPIEPRYLLFALPITLANMVVGIRFFTKPLLGLAGGRVARSVGVGLFAVVVTSYGVGVKAYQAHFTPAAPSKLDWRSAAQLYAAKASDESCLIVVDHVSWAVVKPLRYYLGDGKAVPCTVDARDPRLLSIAEAHRDLWWAVEVDFGDDREVQRLRASLGTAHDLSPFLGVVVLHPTSPSPTPTPYIEQTLLQFVAALEPTGDEHGTLLGSRTALANVYALTGRPDEAARVLTEFPLLMRFRILPIWWSDVDTALSRGDIESARSDALWIVTVDPGNPDAYDRLAEVERRAGSGTAAAYEALAAALRAARQ